MTVPGIGITTFKYDACGRRIYKQSPSFTTIFVYDADNLLDMLNASGSEVASYAQTWKLDDTPAELHSSTTDYLRNGRLRILHISEHFGRRSRDRVYLRFLRQHHELYWACPGTRSSTRGREFDSEVGLYFKVAAGSVPASLIGRTIVAIAITTVGMWSVRAGTRNLWLWGGFLWVA